MILDLLVSRWVRVAVVLGWAGVVAMVTGWQWGGVRNSWEGQLSAQAATVARIATGGGRGGATDDVVAAFPELGNRTDGDLAEVVGGGVSWHSPGVKGSGPGGAGGLGDLAEQAAGAGVRACKLFGVSSTEAARVRGATDASAMVGVYVDASVSGGPVGARAVYLRPAWGYWAERLRLAGFNSVMLFLPVAVLAAVCPTRWGK